MTTPPPSAAKRKREDDEVEEKIPSVKALNYTDVITVLVGPGEEVCIVHKELICSKSPFFAAACSDHWKEGEVNIVRLPTIDPYTFKLYVHHAYTNILDLSMFNVKQATGLGPSYHLCNLYITADILLDGGLKNSVIDNIILTQRSRSLHMPASIYDYVWKHTAPGSTLRRVLIDGAAARSTHKVFAQHGHELPAEFLYEFSLRLLEIRGKTEDSQQPSFEKRCLYYEHQEGEKKCTVVNEA